MTPTNSVDLSKAKLYECSCGNTKFRKDVQVHVVSAIMSPSGKEMAVGSEVYSCTKCDKVLSLSHSQSREIN